MQEEIEKLVIVLLIAESKDAIRNGSQNND